MASEESRFLEQINENFLVCGICSERYKNAKLLSCLHSFCEPCLSKLVEGDSLVCPNCRRTHQVPSVGASGLAGNTFVNQLVEQFKQREEKSVNVGKCEGCQEGTVTQRCTDCAINFCIICAKAHRYVPLTRSHRLLAIAEYEITKSKDPSSVQRPTYCSKHPDNQLKFYCDTCEGPICLECTAIDHPRPEHKYRYLDEAAADYTKEVTTMIQDLKTKEAEASDSKSEVEKMADSLEQRYQEEEVKVKDHIDKTIEETTRKIQDNGKELLGEMKAEYDRRRTNLQAQLKEIECIESDLTNSREFAENIMHYGNASQLMTARKGMTSQIQEVMTLETKCSPTEDDYMEFHPIDDFCTAKMLGTITMQTTQYKLLDIPEFVRVKEDLTFKVSTEQPTKKKDVTAVQDVRAEMKTPDKKTQDMTVRDNKDGTFSLKSQTQIEGDHQLSVSVCKKPLHGSPVNVKVIPQKGLVRKFGGKGSGQGEIDMPWGVTMTKSGSVIVNEEKNYRMQLFSLQGQHQRFIQFTNFPSSYLPIYSVISDEGLIFTADYCNNRVVVCDENGKLIRHFGEDKLEQPFGVALSASNHRVYVSDRSLSCVLIYTQDGDFIKSFGDETRGDGKLLCPYDIVISSITGNVYVSDYESHTVKVYSDDGDYLYSIGCQGSGDGQLNNPTGLTTDKHDNVYVCDYGNNRVQKFNSLGKFINVVDCGTDPLSRPVGVCVTDEEPFGKVIVAEQNANYIRVINQ
ncbi:E3 ubiquitin-protein ligase TRIM71-like [Glandiceps talaboti]